MHTKHHPLACNVKSVAMETILTANFGLHGNQITHNYKMTWRDPIQYIYYHIYQWKAMVLNILKSYIRFAYVLYEGSYLKKTENNYSYISSAETFCPITAVI